jgi:arsenite-transporting ATPase
MSLDSLLHSVLTNNLKFIFVGGKGGVGKTTSSSAIATLLAQHCHKRILLVSTDPAHSLSDAFRCSFSNVPTSPGIPNLDVMEVDPAETMEAELQKWAELMKDLALDRNNDQGSGDNNDMVHKLQHFHEWLSGIPGIDEATALSSAIQHIESNKYDVIVFDTAPTGHTLKLLGMPDILQTGIEKLQSWQSTLWGYWEVFKGMGSEASKKRAHVKESVATMLSEYKRGIQKVACMLQDQNRTRFIVVCIAEYLSISETQRLLRELKKNKVMASHVIVNQLVVKNALSSSELTELEALAEVGSLNLNQTLLAKTVHACRLTTARKDIQEKYLGQLKSFEETSEILDGICEVPLLAEEVTGVDALVRFADYLICTPPAVSEAAILNDSGPMQLYDDQLSEKLTEGNGGDTVEEKKSDDKDTASWTPTKGDIVRITGLEKSGQYNGLEGTLVSPLDPETNRCGIRIKHQGQFKTLALQMKNMDLLHKGSKKAKCEETTDSTSDTTSIEQNVSKAKQLLDDPEITALIDSNPKFRDAVDDVLSNPMNVMKYLADPEMSPLISKAMSKLKF